MPIEAGADAIGNYDYQVDVDGVALAQFKEASGLGTEVSVIEQIENKPGGIPVTLKLPGIDLRTRRQDGFQAILSGLLG